MKQFVPRDKMSKRQQKELDAQKRTVWNIKPTTKVVQSKKIYDRKKQPRNYEPYDFRGCFYMRFSDSMMLLFLLPLDQHGLLSAAVIK